MIIRTSAGGYWHYQEVPDSYAAPKGMEPIVTPTPQAGDFKRLHDKLRRQHAAEEFDEAAERWKDRHL